MTKYYVANWKMNQSVASARSFVKELKKVPQKLLAGKRLVICPPYTLLPVLKSSAAKSRVAVGAQSVSKYDNGPYTGEISAKMLKEQAVQYAIVGHSDRRRNFNETYEDVNAKIKKLYLQKIIPIICVGENLKERQKKITANIINNQLNTALKGISVKGRRIIITYEPIWAISTSLSGKKVNSKDLIKPIEHITTFIRQYRFRPAKEITILYGGSITKQNVGAIMKVHGVSGGLIGGASLTVKHFLNIVKNS